MGYNTHVSAWGGHTLSREATSTLCTSDTDPFVFCFAWRLRCVAGWPGEGEEAMSEFEKFMDSSECRQSSNQVADSSDEEDVANLSAGMAAMDAVSCCGRLIVFVKFGAPMMLVFAHMLVDCH